MEPKTVTDIESVQAPAVIRELKQWLIWRLENNPHGPKPRKMPYYAWSGRTRGKQNTPDDIRQLVGFSEAKAAAAKKGPEWGVGLAMIKGSPVTALDFDRCVTTGTDGKPEIYSDVAQMIDGTYAEISPSGTGVRAFVSGEVGNGRQAHHEDWEYGLELFNGTGFVTFTGNVTENTKLFGDENTVGKPTRALLEHIEKRFGPAAPKEKAPASGDYEVFTMSGPRVGMSVEQLREMLTYLDPNMGNKEWHDLGAALHHETEGSPEGCALWDEWSAEGNGYPGTQYFEHRWEGFDSTKENAIRIVSYFKQAQEGAKAQGKTWNIPKNNPALSLPPQPDKGHFGLCSFADFIADEIEEEDWFIEGFLPRADMGMLFGASGSGKSFLALDMCLAISRGVEWNGRWVQQGRVLYVAAEGSRGFRKRGRAYCEFHGLDPAEFPMQIIHRLIPNLTDATSVAKLVEDVTALGPFDLIVLDTFAQVTPGANENSGEHMGDALANCRLIRAPHDSMILLVHHVGKDSSRGARGWSGLKAAADVELEVVNNENARHVEVTKMKDGETGFIQGFTLATVVLGTDSRGDDISSCVVQYNTRGKVSEAETGVKGANKKIVLASLHELLSFDGAPVPHSALWKLVESKLTRGDKAKDPRPRQFSAALASLITDKRVEKCGFSGEETYSVVSDDA